MKQLIFSVSIVFLLASLPLSAQFRYTGQWSIHTSASPVLSNGFNVNLGIEKSFINSIGSIVADIDYMRNKKFIELTDFHISTLCLSVSYFYSFERLIKPPFFINIGAGVIAGTEIFEKKTLPKGVLQNAGSRFVYGFRIEPQFEYLLGRKTSLYIKTEMKYFQRTRFDKFFFCPGLGIKIYL